MEQENCIDFKISSDQAEKICKYCDRTIDELEEYEICELLDEIIDNLEVE